MQTISCDVVFLGASTPNLLCATALLQRFENIKIRIVETAAAVTPPPSFVTAISSDAWKALAEIDANLTKKIDMSGDILPMTMSEEDAITNLNGARHISADKLYTALVANIPPNLFCMEQTVKSIQEQADCIHFQTENGTVYETKLLIVDDKELMEVFTVSKEYSGFVEVGFTVSDLHLPTYISNTKHDSDVYVNRIPTGDTSSAISVLMKADDPKATKELNTLQSVLFFGSEMSPVFSQPLCSVTHSSVRGRTGQSGEFSSSIPYFSSLRLECECEEALLLRRCVLLKGLTAAAVSDWKRRRTASSKTQFLKEISSPIEFFSNAEEVINDGSASSDTNTAHDSAMGFNSFALGKPLVCTNMKPYTALSSID